MKLISTAERQSIKAFFAWCLRMLKAFFTQELIVGILFFVIWCNILIGVTDVFANIFFFIIALIAPFILLIAVVQYKSRWAYAAVQATFIFMMFHHFSNFIYYLVHYITPSQDILWLVSFCLECEIEKSVELIICCLVALSIMHNSRMVLKYNWSAPWFYRTLLVGFLLILASTLIIFLL